MTPTTALDLYQAELISKPEVLSKLESIEVRATYDRDYCDTFDEYSRQQKIISDAQRFAAAIRRNIF